MRVYAFVNVYPSEYKPYYDTQFADLLRQGHELRIFSLASSPGGITERVRRHGLDRLTTRVPGDELRGLAPFAGRLAVRAIRHPAARSRAARRVVATGHDSLKQAVKAALRATLLPLAPPDLAVVHGHRTMAVFDWLPRLWPGVPVGLYYYGGDPVEAGSLDPARMARVFAAPSAIVTLSRYARDELARWGVPPERVTILPLAFEPAEFTPPRPRTYRRDGLLRLVLAGRLTEGKGHRYALQALALLRDAGLDRVRLDIVGDGPLRPEIEEEIGRWSLGTQVELAGAMDNRELIDLFGRADALLLASHEIPTWAETQGTVIQEAMLMEALAITTRTGGVPDSIPPELEPFHVAARDPEALAGAIRRLCQLSVEETAALGARCRRWVVEHFDVRDFNRRLLEAVSSRRLPRIGGSDPVGQALQLPVEGLPNSEQG